MAFNGLRSLVVIGAALLVSAGAAWGQLGAPFSGTLEPIADGDGTSGTGFLYSVLDYYPEGPKLMVNGTFDGMSSAAAVAHWGDRIFLLTAVPLGVSDDEVHQYRGALPERDVHQYLVLAIDRRDGRIVWERVAGERQPHEATHATSGTYASKLRHHRQRRHSLVARSRHPLRVFAAPVR